MIGWEEDKKWSDIFLPEIKSILGRHLISEPPIEEDQERNTDLMVLKMDAVRIGCRMRRIENLKYEDEFTIRAERPSGAKTELEKIIAGWGNYFFYGFGEEGILYKWTLADLNIFRIWFFRYVKENKGKYPGISKGNVDGSSGFLAFRWSELPGEFVISTGSSPEMFHDCTNCCFHTIDNRCELLNGSSPIKKYPKHCGNFQKMRVAA